MISDIEIQRIIKHYRRKFGRDRHIEDCANQSNFPAAVYQAATARDDCGVKHRHQHRIPNTTLENFALILINNQCSISTLSFDDLHESIRRIVQVNNIKRIGKLAIYDTAMRIGGYLTLKPDKIYLHQGTKTGLANLLKKTIHTSTYDLSKLPKIFRNEDVTCAEAEDILCIYKDRFK